MHGDSHGGENPRRGHAQTAKSSTATGNMSSAVAGNPGAQAVGYSPWLLSQHMGASQGACIQHRTVRPPNNPKSRETPLHTELQLQPLSQSCINPSINVVPTSIQEKLWQVLADPSTLAVQQTSMHLLHCSRQTAAHETIATVLQLPIAVDVSHKAHQHTCAHKPKLCAGRQHGTMAWKHQPLSHA